MTKRLDVKKRFSEEQIIGFLREVEADMPVKDLCRKHGFSEASYYLWRSKFGGMSVPERAGALSGRPEAERASFAGDCRHECKRLPLRAAARA